MKFSQYNPGDYLPEDDSELDALIASSTETIGTPTDLLPRIEGRIRTRARRRMLFSSVGLAAAAMIAIYSVVQFIPTTTVPVEIEEKIVENIESNNFNQAQSQVARIRFNQNSDIIAIKHETQDPTVSIVWVYQPARTPSDDDADKQDINEKINLQG